MKLEYRQREKHYTVNQKKLLAQAHILDQETGATNPEVISYSYGDYVK